MKVQINKIAEIRSGYLFKESIRADKGGNVAVVQLKDVDDRGIIDLKSLYKIKLENIEMSNFISEGEILFKAKTNKPIAAVVINIPPNTIVTAHYFVITIKNLIVRSGYLAWYLNQQPAKIYFDKHAGGTRIQIINKQVLGNLEIEVPDLSIQAKIEKLYLLNNKEQDLMDLLKEKKRILIEAQLLSLIKKHVKEKLYE
ncbi:MAG: restriction endonuclease subunit S [Actinobacteria bacterium]|nr:restriction endonuclease subunit S [Actinomycetota bacterium]MBL7197289.1 restriction endonuclease subunit S [Candidatus Omnitrophota bacterium]